MDIIRQVAYCPHCSNVATQKLIHTQPYRTHAFLLDGTPTDSDSVECAYFVAECETCNEILLYLAEVDIPKKENFAYAHLVWPQTGSLGKAVPKRISDCYVEAARIRNLAPNAFAVQIRRGLEAICDDRGALKGPLQVRLKHLAERGEMPPVLAEMTDVLRLLGNMGAHSASQSVKAGHVREIDEFFRAIVEYIYVAPNKVKEFRDRLAKKEEGARGKKK